MFPSSSVIVSDTNPINISKTFAFMPLTDAVFSACQGTMSGFSGVTFPAGVVIYANLGNVTLASGSVIFYKV